ncbi:ATP-binding protein, partial [Nonomuraea sp. NPDC055795]
AALTVADEGPGFPPELQKRGSSAGGSTGLGLDIARRTAESSGGAMTVSRAAVELVLGLTQP